MGKNIFLAIVMSMFFAFVDSPSAANTIESIKAPFYIGEDVMVCGTVAEVAKLRGRTMLNIGNTYPREDIGFLIWDNDLQYIEDRLGNITTLNKKRICATGKIEVYNKHLQIKISNPKMLRLMK